MKLADWQELGCLLFGRDPNQWQFVCPDCGQVQKGQDFLDLGLPQRQVDIICSYACIRRWTDQKCMSAGRGPVVMVITPEEPTRPTFSFNT